MGRSCRSPATCRVYTSMFRAPLWHGASPTHFPPRPRKSAWHCDITDVISPHGLSHTLRPANVSYMIPLNMPARQQHAAFTPACFALAMWHGAAQAHFPPRLRKSAMAQRHQELRVTLRVCPHTTSVSYETSSNSHTYKSPKRAFRTRLPQKLTCPSLQNERFVRDVLQKSRGNTHRSTHITHPCQAVRGIAASSKQS